MTNITILTKYTSQGASSRYRYFLYIHKMLQEELNIEIDSFLNTAYLQRRYSGQRTSLWNVFISYIKRFFVVLNSADNLIIEYEIFPFLPYAFERFLLRNKRYILNFDDNVWENYNNRTLLKNKFDKLVQSADGVIVANDFLFQKAKALNDNIIKIPTVVDLEGYANDNDVEKFEKFSIVWIGTPATYKFIKSHAHIFQKLSEKIDFQLVIVAKKDLERDPIDGVDMLFYDWSSLNEVQLLKQSHIGIMPLDDHPWAKGKSAFKIIQYMAAGLPVVASSIGENNNVVIDSKNGYLASDNEAWIAAIERLYNDENLCEDFAVFSQEKAYDYSLQKYFPPFHAFVKQTFKRG